MKTNCQKVVQKMLEDAVRNGSESALQVAVYLKGELIVDAWAAPENLKVDGRSLFPFFSTGKGIAATAIHRLVERGLLSYDDPIVKHWPEFSAKGKGGITLRHVLRHTAGLSLMPGEDQPDLALDWQGMCGFLAAAAPLHPPGAQRHYHAITYSWLVGETASRADGRDFGRIIQEEVCQPLGIDTIFFGVPEAVRPFCLDAEINPVSSVSDPVTPTPADPVRQQAIPSYVCPLEDWINREDVRSACIPASNGFGNARGIARHYASLLGKGVDGVRLLQESTVDVARVWNPSVQGAIPGDGRWGLGYGLKGPDDAPGAVFGHGGYGGSIGFADAQHELAVAVVKSRMGGTFTDQMVETIRSCVGCN